jgi:hypothetical protein
LFPELDKGSYQLQKQEEIGTTEKAKSTAAQLVSAIEIR